ncbi:MAG: hypothetical protein ACPG49_02210 [Chitinophagales bacterium]
MSRFLSFLILILFLFGCQQEELFIPVEELALPISKILLNSGDETLYDVTYSAYKLLPSGGCSKGTSSEIIFYKPGIYLPNKSSNILDGLDFDFSFYNIDIGDNQAMHPEFFLDYIEKNPSEFNKAPFKRNLFLKVEKDGKIYQNWWISPFLNVDYKNNSPHDQTGLKFSGTFYQFDDFNDLTYFNALSGIRVEGEIEGTLITQDGQHTLDVDGYFDIFLFTI